MKKLPAGFRRCRRLQLALALAALAFAAPVLRAATVVSNLGASAPLNENLNTAGDAAAHAFTTGLTAQTLDGITVNIIANVNGSVRVKLWSGAGSAPATLLEDLGMMNVGGPAANYTRSSTTHPLLTAGTRYWVTVHYVSGDLIWPISNTTNTTGPGAMLDNQADSTDDGANWSGYTQDDRHLFAVTGSFVVTTTNDSGTGSLRQALADAATAAGADTITFATNLSGQTIQLTNFSGTGNDKSSLIISNDIGGVTIDATALPGGLTLKDNGGTTYRLLKVTGSTLTLRGLTFKDGGISTFGNSSGGAIFSSASTVTIERCTFSGNIGDGGGAIFNADGPMTLRHCTLSGNTTSSAGPNTGDGGAIFNLTGPMTLTHCTVVSNTAPTGQPGTGGIMGYLGTVTLENCIVAGNTASGVAGDVRYHSSTLNSTGTNIVPVSVNGGGAFTGNTLLTNAPLLSALANWGGGTRTCYPLPGSPARDAASVVAGVTNDQRGATLPASGRDIGAVEAGAGVPGLSLVVNTTADEFNGTDVNGLSLREAVTLAPAGNTPTFATNLAGLAVTLTNDLAVANLTLLTTVGATNVAVAVTAGTLSFRDGSAWTGTGQILLGATNGTAAATVEVNGPDNFTLAAPITVRAGSSGTKALRAANVSSVSGVTINTFAGAITLLADATVERVNGSVFNEYVDFTGPMDLGANVLTVTANDIVYFTGPVGRSDAGTAPAQLVITGSRSLYLRGTSDNPRLTATVTGATLVLAKTSSASVHTLGSGLPVGTIALTVAGGATVNVGSGGSGGDQIADTASVTVDGVLNLLASETLDALNGGGTVRALSSSTLTLGAGNDSGNFTGSLNDGGGASPLSLTKIGTNTQTVAGGNMSGALTVSNGTLNVLGSLPNISSATVQSGATLAGIGTVVNLTLASGSFLAPGNATNAASIGTLNVVTFSSHPGNLTWNGGATARFHLSNTNNTSDKVALASQLVKGSAGTYTFDFQNTGAPGQTYTLATFTNSTFTASDFAFTNLAPGLNGVFAMNAGNLTFTPAAPQIAGVVKLGNGTMQLTFTNPPAGLFTILAATNVTLPLSNWTILGFPSEAPPGQYQFTDTQATNYPRRFYRIRSP